MVTDSGVPAQKIEMGVLFLVKEAAPQLSTNTDSDGDGVSVGVGVGLVGA